MKCNKEYHYFRSHRILLHVSCILHSRIFFCTRRNYVLSNFSSSRSPYSTTLLLRKSNINFSIVCIIYIQGGHFIFPTVLCAFNVYMCNSYSEEIFQVKFNIKWFIFNVHNFYKLQCVYNRDTFKRYLF